MYRRDDGGWWWVVGGARMNLDPCTVPFQIYLPTWTYLHPDLLGGGTLSRNGVGRGCYETGSQAQFVLPLAAVTVSR